MIHSPFPTKNQGVESMDLIALGDSMRSLGLMKVSGAGFRGLGV